MTDEEKLKAICGQLDKEIAQTVSDIKERQEAHQELIDRLDQIINLLDKIASNTY